MPRMRCKFLPCIHRLRTLDVMSFAEPTRRSGGSFVSQLCIRGEPDNAFRELIVRIFAQDRVIVESQRPEELPLDLSEELTS